MQFVNPREGDARRRPVPPRGDVLDLAILGLLQEQELHGYEIRRRLRDELGLFANISFGSLYPALSRLERPRRLVGRRGRRRRRRPAVPPIPITGSLSGERAGLRSRRERRRSGHQAVAQGLPDHRAGRQRFEELLGDDEPAADDARSFGLRLAFARHLAPQARLGLLERRRAHWPSASPRTGPGPRPASGLDAYTRSWSSTRTESTEQDIAWIDRLIEAERRTESQPQSQHPQPCPTPVATRPWWPPARRREPTQ